MGQIYNTHHSAVGTGHSETVSETHSHFDAGGEDGGSEREGVGADWSDDHAGDAGVDHTGPCCQGVGRAACRGGDDDPWEGGG